MAKHKVRLNWGGNLEAVKQHEQACEQANAAKKRRKKKKRKRYLSGKPRKVGRVDLQAYYETTHWKRRRAMNNFFTIEPDLPGYPAVWSPCKQYRYVLWRCWTFDKHPSYIAWVGLNPSKANETQPDNTLTRCVTFSKRWGYGAMVMLNLFAYRSTDPKKMQKADAPIGRDNDRWLRTVCKGADKVMCCWGNGGAFLGRQKEVLYTLRNNRVTLNVLSLNGSGAPLHPLYAKGDLQPREWV